MATSTDSHPPPALPPEVGLGGRRSGLLPTSWTPGRELAIVEWLKHGRLLGALGRASGWWLGDWVRYGNARYGDKYTAAAELTGYDAHTLTNMAYVAGRFEVARRRENLSFSHHAALAALPTDDQELWLQRVEVGNLSVRSLRSELRAVQRRVAARAEVPKARAPNGRPRRRHTQNEPDARQGPVFVCPSCGHHISGVDGTTGSATHSKARDA